MIDLQKVAAYLTARQLWERPLTAWSRDEILDLAATFFSAVGPTIPAAGWQAPYLNDEGDLIIPVDSHPRYHWWSPDGQSIIDTLMEIGASPEVVKRYVRLNKEAPF